MNNPLGNPLGNPIGGGSLQDDLNKNGTFGVSQGAEPLFITVVNRTRSRRLFEIVLGCVGTMADDFIERRDGDSSWSS